MLRNLHLIWPTKTPKWSEMTDDRSLFATLLQMSIASFNSLQSFSNRKLASSLFFKYLTSSLFVSHLSQCTPMFHFYTPQKRQKTKSCSDVFKGCRNNIGVHWVNDCLTTDFSNDTCFAQSNFVIMVRI